MPNTDRPDALDALDRQLAAQSLPYMGLARVALWVAGSFYGLLGLAMPPLLYMSFTIDPQFQGDAVAPWFGAGFGLLGGLCSGGIGALNAAVAVGLGRGSKWAWFGGLILGGLYLPSICLPFGAAIFVALLQADARALFLDDRLPG
jgi:hypothetical protein